MKVGYRFDKGYYIRTLRCTRLLFTLSCYFDVLSSAI